MVKKRLLIVDDEAKNIELAKVILKKEGYVLHFAMRGDEAIEILNRYDIDVLVLDLMLPDMTGFELLATLRTRIHYASMHVIIVSALDDERTIRTCYEQGANEYLAKPYDILQLKALLKRAVQPTFQSKTACDAYLGELFADADMAFFTSHENELVRRFLESAPNEIELWVQLHYLAWFFRGVKHRVDMPLQLHEQRVQTDGFKLVGHALFDALQARLNALVLRKLLVASAIDAEALMQHSSSYFSH